MSPVHTLPELGIALFDEKSEDRKAKERQIQAVAYRFTKTPLLPSMVSELPWQYWKPHLSQAFSATRAPPHMISLEMRLMACY